LGLLRSRGIAGFLNEKYVKKIALKMSGVDLLSPREIENTKS
jgi:hypothetical protein